jgi:superfamily II DNA/RNA helicase
MTFSDLGLSPEVLKAIEDSGYTTPTPIQDQAIPYVLMGRDVLGCAQTGTGKTASFTLPMIDMLAKGRARARMPRSLILEPTRELAAQVSETFERYGKYNKLSMALLVGGTSLTEQEKRLDRGVDVLIATPGRLIDLFERGKILLADVKVLVIDEADRMLDMGFIPDVERIVGVLPKIRQTLFFSATMPPEIRRLADAFLMNPKEVTVSPPTSTAATVEQAILQIAGKPKEKREALRALLRAEDINTALIFCNRKRDVGVLHRSLERHGFSAAALHGDMAQPARTATLASFKKGEIQLLVCSDVAARGLDIPAVSHVINFDVPVHAEDYIHRIGRTGRAGRSGKAFTLVMPEDGKALGAVTRLIGRKLPAVTLDGLPAESTLDEDHEDEAPREARGQGRGQRRERGRRGGAKGGARGDARDGGRQEGAPSNGAARDHDDSKRSDDKRPDDRRPDDRRPDERRHDGKHRDGGGRKDRGRDRGERKPSDQPSNPTPSFGDHTPAFLLRPVKLAAMA